MDESKKKIRSKILIVLSVLFGIISVILGFLIYAKKDEEAKFLKDNFNIQTNFRSLNTNVDKVIDSLFSFGTLSKKNDNESQMVDNKITYLYIGDNLYRTNDNQVSTIYSGIVLGIYTEKDGTDTIVVSYDNGVIASYFSIINTKVKTYDQLEKGDYIGGYENEFKALFKRGNSLISIDEASN